MSSSSVYESHCVDGNVQEPWRVETESVQIENVQEPWRVEIESVQIENVQEPWRMETRTWSGNVQVWMLMMEVGNRKVKVVVNMCWGIENASLRLGWETRQMAYIHHVRTLLLALPFPSVVL